jgi:uncharacterized phage protein gp47/JayE
MATAPELKNPLELIKDWRARIGSRTGITNFSSDSSMRSLMDVLAKEVSSLRESQINSFYSGQLSRARGADLDKIGQDMNLPRLQSTFASSNAREQNGAFYVDSGTFGDLNAAADIVIPAGATVYSDERQNELGARIEYVTTSQVTLPAGDAVGYVSTKAAGAGQNFNVGAGVLRNHDFADYALASAGGLKFTNFFAILNARSQEDDTSYRFRLTKYYDKLVSRNDTKVLVNALQIPGVINLKMIPGYYGIGTTGVVVLGADYESSDSLVSSVQTQLNSLSIPGLNLVAVSATKVTVDLELLIGTTRNLTTAGQRQFEVEIRRVVKEFLRNIQIGGSLDLSELEVVLKEKTNSAIRIGRRIGGVQKVFKKVYLRRSAATSLSSEREQLISSTLSLETSEFLDLGTIDFSYE